ncbi:DUF5082 family protein [Oceanobacillus sp. J11TS1]|uniref:YwqH-like family protein n=1 Tax=Oceanobacillus sp. J11TS1 TaxID=2807191 RepID=UPI001B272878|nr:DUF5082 family protein [Oceanobacillus sp. J11TS1]GIO23675.1 hypothetical protein J11TS1_22560 [Oceanobacillus sp. J11TS1]
MGAEKSLSSLKKQKEQVELGMENSRDMIADAADKVQRLLDASNALDTKIQSLRSVKETIDGFEVTKAKWEGEIEKQFEARYNSYGGYVGIYDTDTSNAKQQIDEDLETARQEKALAVEGYKNLLILMDNIESDIKLAKED